MTPQQQDIHPDRDHMFHLISRFFFWRGMKQDLGDFVSHCGPCQANKAKTKAPGGLQEPLQIPDYPFQSISMDFITKLPVTPEGNDTLIVWVDRLTKYVAVHACKEAHTAEQFASFTIDNVISKHGCPESFCLTETSGLLLSSGKPQQNSWGQKGGCPLLSTLSLMARQSA